MGILGICGAPVRHRTTAVPAAKSEVAKGSKVTTVITLVSEVTVQIPEITIDLLRITNVWLVRFLLQTQNIQPYLGGAGW